MIKPIPDESEPTPEAHAGADAATAARRLRPPQAAPAQRDPREDMCIDECLGGIGPAYGQRRFEPCELCCVKEYCYSY
jgi:hypothetical protein